MLTKAVVALYVMGFTAVMAGVQPSNVPGCVSKCWDNTQYVSTCAGETKCLCDDAEFQNAVFQCLYSQCPTAMFGSALHHTLSVCNSDQEPKKDDKPAAPASTAPALLRQQPARKAKRNYPYQSVSASVTMSARQTHTQTMSINRPTTTARGSAYGGNPWKPSPVPKQPHNPYKAPEPYKKPEPVHPVHPEHPMHPEHPEHHEQSHHY